MKLGLDFHGVCDTYPEIYRPLTQALLSAYYSDPRRTQINEVHIITGGRKSSKILKVLEELGIVHTHFFSILDYHAESGTTRIWNDDKGQPWMEEHLWNPTKAEYCERMGIDLMIDDSPIYGSYFDGKTVYMLQRDPTKQDVWMKLAGRK